MSEFRERKKQEALQQKRIKQLLSISENQKCCDCSERNPMWASVNLGCFLCIRCAGLHRKLGTDVSKVKSINLDIWQEEWFQTMEQNGNAAVNNKFFSRTTPIVNSKSDEAMATLIEEKYLMRKYSNSPKETEIQSFEVANRKNKASFSKESWNGQLQAMLNMGFDENVAVAALSKTSGNLQASIELAIESGSNQLGSKPLPKKPEETLMDQLLKLGYLDIDLNTKALKIANGNLKKAIELLEERKAKFAKQDQNQTAFSQFSNANAFQQANTNQYSNAMNMNPSNQLVNGQQAMSNQYSMQSQIAGVNNQQANPFQLQNQFNGINADLQMINSQLSHLPQNQEKQNNNYLNDVPLYQQSNQKQQISNQNQNLSQFQMINQQQDLNQTQFQVQKQNQFQLPSQNQNQNPFQLPNLQQNQNQNPFQLPHLQQNQNQNPFQLPIPQQNQNQAQFQPPKQQQNQQLYQNQLQNSFQLPSQQQNQPTQFQNQFQLPNQQQSQFQYPNQLPPPNQQQNQFNPSSSNPFQSQLPIANQSSDEQLFQKQQLEFAAQQSKQGILSKFHLPNNSQQPQYFSMQQQSFNNSYVQHMPRAQQQQPLEDMQGSLFKTHADPITKPKVNQDNLFADLDIFKK